MCEKTCLILYIYIRSNMFDQTCLYIYIYIYIRSNMFFHTFQYKAIINYVLLSLIDPRRSAKSHARASSWDGRKYWYC